MSISFAQVPEGVVVWREEELFIITDDCYAPIGNLRSLVEEPREKIRSVLLSAHKKYPGPVKRLLQGKPAGNPLPELPRFEPWVDPTLTTILGAGVTFANSLRERRLETFRAGELVDATDDGRPTPYDVVYDTANPPEVFVKAMHYGHIAEPNEIWIRPDGAKDGTFGSSVPEPERVLLVNPAGEIVAHTIGSDTTARQLESLSPLYLPAAKTYRGCTTLCPWLTLYEPDREVTISMEIQRGGNQLYFDEYSSSTMKRTPESLVRHARTMAPEPNGVFIGGFALFTGTGIIPPVEFSLQAGDRVIIDSPQLGRIDAITKVVEYNF